MRVEGYGCCGFLGVAKIFGGEGIEVAKLDRLYRYRTCISRMNRLTYMHYFGCFRFIESIYQIH